MTGEKRLNPRRPGTQRRALSDHRGFTLLETLLALLILAVALLGLAQLFALSIQVTGSARHNTMSMGVGQAKLEQLKTLYNAELTTGTSGAELQPGDHGPEVFTLAAPVYSQQGDRNFLVRWQVSTLGTAGKQVTVTVNPEFGNSVDRRTLTLTSHFMP